MCAMHELLEDARNSLYFTTVLYKNNLNGQLEAVQYFSARLRTDYRGPHSGHDQNGCSISNAYTSHLMRTSKIRSV